MLTKKIMIRFLICALLLNACAYIVLPEEVETSNGHSQGWSAVAINVVQNAAGDLHVDLALRNDTADWSAMKAANEPAVLMDAQGGNSNCDTVFVSSGGHRLAPGFQMRGYVAGTKSEPKIQTIYVECKGAQATKGAKIVIDYSYVTGEYNYYYQDANKVDATLQVDLDQVAADLKYPVGVAVDGLIQKPDVEIIAINDVKLGLTQVARTEKGLSFAWQTANPGEYPSYVHIGRPPVIGEDGILYGLYESPDLASVPITPAKDKAEWTTEVAVPQDVRGFYILLSVESKKQRLFVNYAVDVSDQ